MFCHPWPRRHQCQHRGAYGYAGFNADAAFHRASWPRTSGARGLSRNGLPSSLRSDCKICHRNYRCLSHPGNHPPGLVFGYFWPSRPGGHCFARGCLNSISSDADLRRPHPASQICSGCGGSGAAGDKASKRATPRDLGGWWPVGGSRSQRVASLCA